jgi:glycosyltransferase involved in cell wall biosynthesis
MIKISAAIITYNEEKNIERCLSSLDGIADEIVVLDSNSTDNTQKICSKFNVQFLERAFTDYSDQKNWAIDKCNYDIILSLDADEELSDELRKSIIRIKNNWEYDAYVFNRMTNYCGKWIKHTGWYPDKQLRLWDKRMGMWNGAKIHEKLELNKDAKIGKAKGDMLHYSFYTIHQHIAQINKFSELKAETQFKKGKKTNCFKIVFSPAIKFFKHFVLKRGFLDGYYGFVISINSAHSAFLKQIKIREKFNER